MDNIHGNTEDISNKASGYKVLDHPPENISTLLSIKAPSPFAHVYHHIHSIPRIPIFTSATFDSSPTKAKTLNESQGVMNSEKYPEKTKENAAKKFEALGGEQAFMENNGKGE